MRKTLKAALIGAAAALFLVGSSGPAFSATQITEWTQGNDEAWVTEENGTTLDPDGWSFIDVNDRECDGHDAYLRVETSFNTYHNYFDVSGSRPCDLNDWTTYQRDSATIRAKLCEQLPGDNNDICTAWKFTAG